MPSARVRAYGLAGLVFALDRLTKWIVESHVGLMDTYRVIPGFFDIVHSRNPGVVFGLFSESTFEWRTFLLVALSGLALIVLGAMLWQTSRLDSLTIAGLSLIMGGAAGNLFDRIVRGEVTDFLEFYVGSLHWPTFNVADSAIVAGSCLLLLAIRKPRRQAAQI